VFCNVFSMATGKRSEHLHDAGKGRRIQNAIKKPERGRAQAKDMRT